MLAAPQRRSQRLLCGRRRQGKQSAAVAGRRLQPRRICGRIAATATDASAAGCGGRRLQNNSATAAAAGRMRSCGAANNSDLQLFHVRSRKNC